MKKKKEKPKNHGGHVRNGSLHHHELGNQASGEDHGDEHEPCIDVPALQLLWALGQRVCRQNGTGHVDQQP